MTNLNRRFHTARTFVTPRRYGLPTLASLLLATGAALTLGACSRAAPPAQSSQAATDGEQQLVERSAEALASLRKNPRFARIEPILQRARGVLIFPRLVKASLIVGGEGGNGVLVARQPDGSWSDPAFYSLGAPSLGLQLGYQQAVVVLFIMDDATLERALHSSVALGGKAGATLGNIDDLDRTRGDVLTANIYQVVEAEGAFAGVSLDGYVIGARPQHNRNYYGTSLTARDILLDGKAPRRSSASLKRALAPSAG
jgi:lipid-binding SYLF domain-containing protein